MGQIKLGILNVMLLAPVWLQIVHLFVAEFFWVLVVLASATLLFSSVEVDSEARPGLTGSDLSVWVRSLTR